MRIPNGDGDAHYYVNGSSLEGLRAFCVIPVLSHAAKGETVDTVERSGAAGGLGEEGMKRQGAGTFRETKLFWMILQWRIQVAVRLSKATERTTARVSPHVNCGLELILGCQYGSLVWPNVPRSCKGVVMRKNVGEGEGVHGNSLYSPLLFP